MALRSSSRIASIVIAFSMLIALLIVSPAPASTSESLVTCLNLETGKERVSRTSKCPITQAVSKWRLVTADSGIGPGSSTKTMSICSNKENSSPVYRIIRNRCSKNMQKNLYAREVTLPSKPVIAEVVSRSGGSASITLANDPGSNLDSPIAYYTVTSSKGDVIRVNSSNSLTLLVNGLRASNDYSFTVTATNADGTSPISNVSQLVNIQAPVSPKPVTTVAQVISCANGGECAVGDTGPGGGKIFYVATTPFACGPTRATTCNYLEAAPALWNGGLADPTRRWANITYQDATVNNASSPETATATAIGWGYFNTRAIVNQGNSDTATSAAALADSYSVTVSGVLYEDWFLPSKDELNELYLQKATVGGFTNNNFWSSSERFFVTSNAWYQFFGNGYQNLHLKGNPYYVRPIRAF